PIRGLFPKYDEVSPGEVKNEHNDRGETLSREAGPEDLSGNLVVQLGLATKPLTGIGTSATRAKRSNASSIGCGIRYCGGWGRLVLGRSRGREAHGPAPAQPVGDQFQAGGALGDHRRRQVGRKRSQPIRSTSSSFF